ncbi:uncharacterized protein LOC141764155 [Sebastes fasciatus]|uniref:uncharacterized protein LOC141764155 n=1 Tax=Sebastes fasciatus TaxID=394691 RepID=UPI003D9DB424
MPELSPTWTYQNISTSTQLTSGMDTSRPANLSTASNSTKGEEQNSSTGTVLYATVGAVAMMITFLMLAMIGMKRLANSKPQPQVCFNSTALVSADEREAECEYDDIGEEVQPIKTISERFSHHPKQDPPTAASTAAESSEHLHIYENICCSKGTAHSRYPAANVRDEHDNSSGIYIKPLPSVSAGKGCLRKHTNKPTATTNATSKPTESCASNNASACHPRSCIDSTEVRPRSLWFGLDLSGTV